MQETINERIARFRKRAGITQAKMAEMMNLNLSTYAKRELHGKIDCDFLIEVSRILDVDVRVLLLGVEAPCSESTPKPNKFNLNPREECAIHILRDIKEPKRSALYKLILAVSENKSFDIVNGVESLIEKINTKKTYD